MLHFDGRQLARDENLDSETWRGVQQKQELVSRTGLVKWN